MAERILYKSFCSDKHNSIVRIALLIDQNKIVFFFLNELSLFLFNA